jgi:hypothetical protein
LRRDHLHYLYPRASHLSFTEFLRNPLTRAQVSNLQVRTIAYDFDIEAVSRSVGRPLTAKLEMEQHINEILSGLPDSIDEQLLSLAKQRLSQFKFVGLTN